MEVNIKKLNTPKKIQNFLDKTPFNFEKGKGACMPPEEVVQKNKAHCFEGAVFACWCLQNAEIENYLMDLKVKNLRKDSDHTLCIFKINRFWGAISKTNHSVLRWRDPIYKNTRELAMSYFHEYFLDTGEKTLKSYSKPFDVWKRYGARWARREKNLDEMAEALDRSPHINFVPRKNGKYIRKAGKTEIKGASITEWNKNGKSAK